MTPWSVGWKIDVLLAVMKTTWISCISTRELGWLGVLSVSSDILKGIFFFWAVSVNSGLKMFSKSSCQQMSCSPGFVVLFIEDRQSRFSIIFKGPRIFRMVNEHWLQLKVTSYIQFSSVQLLSRVRLFETPWIATHQASLSITNSRSSLRLTSIESVMPSSHLILCCPLLLLPPIPPRIRVFCNESTLRMRWTK